MLKNHPEYETELQRLQQTKAYMEEYINSIRAWFVFYNLQGLGSYPGLPDLQAVKDGCTIYIEIKRPGGRQSAK